MKTFKIILLCIIAILGIYGMNKIQFGEKLVIMLPGHAPVRRPGGPPGPPPQVEQGGPQAIVAEGEHEAGPGQEMEHGGLQSPDSAGEGEIPSGEEMKHGESQTSVADGEQIQQGPPPRPQNEEQSKWKVRINFNRGIKNMGYLTLIMAFLVELTYIADRLIRRKPLL